MAAARLATAVAVVQPAADTREPRVVAHAALDAVPPAANSAASAQVAAHAARAPPSFPLANFCFPEHSAWCRVEALERAAPSYYTFALTDGDGRRSYGHCCRFLPGGTGPRFPACLCILSAHDWPALFHDLLSVLAVKAGAALVAGQELLCAGCPLIATLNELCALQLPPGVELARIATGPVDADDGAAAQLLSRLQPAAVCALLAALLHERRVIVTGARLADCSAGVHACAALLAPLRWQHVFLPILPASLLEYVSAPMPFIVGLAAPLLQQVTRLRLPVDKLVVLNCDSGIVEGADDDAAELPGVTKLQASLAAATSGALAAAALQSYVMHCLGSFEAHIHALPPAGASALPAGALRAGGAWFDHAAFVASARSRPVARFRGVLRQSQLFEALVTERMAAFAAGELLARDSSDFVASNGVAGMFAQARAGYRPLREADAENGSEQRSAASGRNWLPQRRPLGSANSIIASGSQTEPQDKCKLSTAEAALAASDHRALIEAAVHCWQRHVSIPLRETMLAPAAMLEAPAESQRIGAADDDMPTSLSGARSLIRDLRQEVAALRLERYARLNLCACTRSVRCCPTCAPCQHAGTSRAQPRPFKVPRRPLPSRRCVPS